MVPTCELTRQRVVKLQSDVVDAASETQAVVLGVISNRVSYRHLVHAVVVADHSHHHRHVTVLLSVQHVPTFNLIPAEFPDSLTVWREYIIILLEKQPYFQW